MTFKSIEKYPNTVRSLLPLPEIVLKCFVSRRFLLYVWKFSFIKGIHATSECLKSFFENLLLCTHHELKNCYLHVEYKSEAPIQSVNVGISKCQNCTLDCTLDELAVLRTIAVNPTITQKDIAAAIGKSERTIKTRTGTLQKIGYLCLVNGMPAARRNRK